MLSNLIIINLTNTSFTIHIMTEYNQYIATVTCRIACAGNIYKVLLPVLFVLNDRHQLYLTNYMTNIIKTPV